MKVIYNFNTLQSRLKRGLVRLIQAFLVPHAEGISDRSLSDWSQEQVPGKDDSERCVEIPWSTSAISRCLGFWLDIGYAHAESRFWQAISGKGWRKFLRYGYGLDISLPKVRAPIPVYIQADIIDCDLNRLPQFNLITCISTLEHIGCDNSLYHPGVQRQKDPFEIQKNVFLRLASKIARPGRLFLSLPYGKREDHGWFLQYDFAMVQSLKEIWGSEKKRRFLERYYHLTGRGWESTEPQRMADISYRPEDKRAAGVALLEFIS